MRVVDAVEEEFGEYHPWLIDVYLGISDPEFPYSDGVTVNFKEITA